MSINKENGGSNRNSVQFDHITIGRQAPDFTASSTQGVITLSQFKEKWIVFFSQPGDFTPVSATELISFEQLLPEFEKRNVQLLALTIDSTFSDIDWLIDIYDTTGVMITYPLMSDRNAEIARLYGMVNPDRIYEESVRDLFIISPKGRIRAVLTYPVSSGRNTYEILRLIDSLQLNDKYKVFTPANWTPGQQVIVPPPYNLNEALQREYESDSLGLKCVDWYLCYKDYNTIVTN